MKIKDVGGPAFPCIGYDIEDPEGNRIFSEGSVGMTLRDYIAIHASNEDVNKYAFRKGVPQCSREKARYQYANAMLIERNINE